MSRLATMWRRMLVTALGTMAVAAFAQTADVPGAAPTESAAPAAALTDGEVRKVDLDNKKLTLRHGPLPSLDMPGMTMVFQVKDEGMLQGVQPGDKVRFAADKIDGKFTVVRLERVN